MGDMNDSLPRPGRQVDLFMLRHVFNISLDVRLLHEAKTQLTIMRDEKAPVREQRGAAEALLDRGYGRVVPATDMRRRSFQFSLSNGLQATGR